MKKILLILSLTMCFQIKTLKAQEYYDDDIVFDDFVDDVPPATLDDSLLFLMALGCMMVYKKTRSKN